MLEENKTYSWKEFWKYCKIGETYKISIIDEPSQPKAIPILDTNEEYFGVMGGHYFENPYFFKATEFLASFLRLLGDKAIDVIDEDVWYGIATYYRCDEHDHYDPKITINEDTLDELMEQYGVEDKEDFYNDYLEKLPNVTRVADMYDETKLHLDLEECDYFGDKGEYTITIKEKKDTWEFEVNGKGIACGDDQDFWGIMDSVTLVVNSIC